MVDFDKVKTRKFVSVLYPDSDSYNCQEVLHYVLENYDCAYILHDRDVWTDEDEKKNSEHKAGTLKKAHYHLVLRWVGMSPRYRGGLAKELKLPKESIEPVMADSIDGALLYLVHAGEKEKYQYDLSEVEGNLTDRLFSLLNYSKEENPLEEQLTEIMEYIECQPNKLKTAELLTFCIHRKYLTAYRKFSYQIHRILDEHNYACYKIEQTIQMNERKLHYQEMEKALEVKKYTPLETYADYEQINLMFNK